MEKESKKKKMLQMRKKRMTLGQIGNAFGVSRQRVFQLIGRTKRDEPDTKGNHMATKKYAKLTVPENVKKAVQIEAIREGVSDHEIVAMMLKAFKTLKKQARVAGEITCPTGDGVSIPVVEVSE